MAERPVVNDLSFQAEQLGKAKLAAEQVGLRLIETFKDMERHTEALGLGGIHVGSTTFEEPVVQAAWQQHQGRTRPRRDLEPPRGDLEPPSMDHEDEIVDNAAIRALR